MTDIDPQLLTGFGSFVGGGVVSGFVNAWVQRKKVPAETDSIIVTGAEKAVVALQAVVEAETARADREAARADRAEEKVASMERRLDAMQGMLNEARDELHAWALEFRNNET